MKVKAIRCVEAGGVIPAFADGERAVDDETKIDILIATQIPDAKPLRCSRWAVRTSNQFPLL
jgi:hypothetical protein